jgi:hypothetical protein
MARAIFAGEYGGNLQLEISSAWNKQDIGNNTSTINIYVRLIANGYVRVFGAEYKTLTILIDGKTVGAYKVDASINPGQSKDLKSADFVVSHYSDGTPPPGYISAKLDIGFAEYSWAAVGEYVHLPTIPRASSIKTSDGVIGGNINITINRAVSSFKHAIKCAWHGKTTVIANNVDTSFAWTIPKDFANDIPNSESGRGTLTVETYSGEKKIGEKSTDFVATVPNNIKPTLTGFTLTDTNTAAASVVPGEQAFIQILSNIKVNFGQATGAYGSTITGYYAEIVGKNQSTNQNGGALGIMNYSGNVTVRARVTDSRGRISNTIDRTVNILEYFSPILKFDVTRSGAESSTLTITRNAKVAPLTVNGSQKNLMKLTFKVAPAGTTTYTVDNGPATGSWTSISNLTNSNANLQGTYAANQSWSVVGVLEDLFTHTEFSAIVGTEAVVLSYGKDKIGFGKIAEISNAVDSEWEYYFKGKSIQNRKLTNPDGRSLTNIYKTVDEYVTTGFYYVDDKKLPDPAGGYLLVESYSVDFIKQTYTPWNKSYEFTRLKKGKDKPWTPWISPALEQCYPIGAIYQSTEVTNPATFMGGTWERFGNGRVLVGVDETDGDFNTANKIGGEKTHTLTIDEMPSHSHRQFVSANNGNDSIRKDWDADGNGKAYDQGMETGRTGGNKPHNNLQPYITVYQWRRIA